MFADVRDKLLQSKPPCAKAVPAMFKFMMKFGSDGAMLQQLDELVTSDGAAKQVGKDMYEVLSEDVKPPGSGHFVNLRYWLLRAGYLQGVTSSDARRILLSKDGQRAAVVNCVSEIHRLVERHLVSDQRAKVHQHLRDFDRDAMLSCVGKAGPLSKPEEAAKQFVDAVEGILRVKLSTKWDAFAVAVATPSSSAATPKPKGKKRDPVYLDYVFVKLFFHATMCRTYRAYKEWFYICKYIHTSCVYICYKCISIFTNHYQLRAKPLALHLRPSSFIIITIASQTIGPALEAKFINHYNNCEPNHWPCA